MLLRDLTCVKYFSSCDKHKKSLDKHIILILEQNNKIQCLNLAAPMNILVFINSGLNICMNKNFLAHSDKPTKNCYHQYIWSIFVHFDFSA